MLIICNQVYALVEGLIFEPWEDSRYTCEAPTLHVPPLLSSSTHVNWFGGCCFRVNM